MTDSLSSDRSDSTKDSQGSQGASHTNERARRFRSCLSPELILRWLVIRDGPFLPGGRLVGMATTPGRNDTNVLRTAKRIVESWPAGFILPTRTGPDHADLPGLVFRSLALSGLMRRALVVAPQARTVEWIRQLESGSLIRFKPLDADSKSLPNDPALLVASIDSLAETGSGESSASEYQWDILFLDGTDSVLSIEVIDKIQHRSRTLFVAQEPNIDRDRALSLIRVFRRTGSFSLDTGIAREYYRMVEEFRNSDGRIPDHDLQILRRAVSEISELDPDYWSQMTDDLGERRLAILKRWLRTGCVLDSREADAVTHALRLAAPLSRVIAQTAPDSQESSDETPGKRTASLISSPVSLEDISGVLAETARPGGVLQSTDHPDVFSVDTGSGDALRMTASRDIFQTDSTGAPGSPSATRCEFASYGGSVFESLLSLLPDPDDLPNWLRRVEVDVTDGAVTITRVAYVASCTDGDRTVLSLRALNGAAIDPAGVPSEEFVASLERYLCQEARSELARIKRSSQLEGANVAAAQRQQAFALEIATALSQQETRDSDIASVRDRMETFALRRHPILITLDRARLFRHSPNLIDLELAIPDEGGMCLSIPPALIAASASEVSAATSEAGSEIDLQTLNQKIDRLLKEETA